MERKMLETVQALIREHFPDCEAAILGGSAVTGGWNEHSDLDIVIVDPETDVCYRETFDVDGQLVEAFVFYDDAYVDHFVESAREGIPTLQMICAHGRVIVNRNQAADRLQEEARRSLEQGPEPWTLDQMNESRYELTDLSNDLKMDLPLLEQWMLFHRVAWLGMEFALRVNERWCGEGKWMVRELRRLDPALCDRLADAVQRYGKDRDQPH